MRYREGMVWALPDIERTGLLPHNPTGMVIWNAECGFNHMTELTVPLVSAEGADGSSAGPAKKV